MDSKLLEKQENSRPEERPQSLRVEALEERLAPGGLSIGLGVHVGVGISLGCGCGCK